MALGWIAAGLAGAGMLFGANQSGKSAEALEERNEILEDQLEFAKKRYDAYKKQYGPVEDRLVADAMAAGEGDYERVTSAAAENVASQFDAQRGEQERNMQRLGIDPSSGRFSGAQRQAGLQEAAATAGAVNRARTQERAQTEQREDRLRSQAAQFGLTKGANAQEMMSSARRGLAQAKGDQAQMHQNAAQSAFQGAGQLVGIGLSSGLGAESGGGGLLSSANLFDGFSGDDGRAPGISAERPNMRPTMRRGPGRRRNGRLNP